MDYTSFIFSNAPQDVNTPILIDADRPERQITWKEYASGVKRIAVGLKSIGLSEQQCVALVAGNDIYAAILGDGVVAAGAIFVSPPADASHQELVSALQVARVDWIFAEATSLERVRAATEECGIGAERTLLFDPPNAHHSAQADLVEEQAQRSYSALNACNEEEYSNRNIGKNAELLIANRLFTSGTTGNAKAADISHAATLHRLQGRLWCSGDFPKNLHFIGMHHASGTGVRQRAAAAMHCSMITRAQDPSQIVDLIKNHRIETTILPPRTMIAISRLVQDGLRKKADIASIRLINVGGSSITNQSMDEFRKLLHPDAVLRPAYGSTECGTISGGAWTNSKHYESDGYVGTVTAGVQVKILEPDTVAVLGLDVDGEVCVASPSMFNGYCRNDDATKSASLFDADGKRWFRTGDKGKLIAKNELYITGRYKEVFKVGTEEVAPAEVETALMQHPAVKDAAVTHVPDRNDEDYNEVKAYIVSEDNAAVCPQTIVDHVAANLSAHKAPTGGVIFTKSIPRNAMKKVVKKDLDSVTVLPGSAEYLKVTG
ncbi:hypothetical protein BST61_g10957 [Cercospora zeina]